MPEPPPGEGRCRVGSAPAPDARRGKDCVAGKAEAPRQQHNVLLSEQGLEMRVLMVGASSGSAEAPSAATRLPRGPAGGGTRGAGTPPRHPGVRHRVQPTAVMATGAGGTACSVAMGVPSPGTEPLGFAWVKPRGAEPGRVWVLRGFVGWPVPACCLCPEFLVSHGRVTSCCWWGAAGAARVGHRKPQGLAREQESVPETELGASLVDVLKMGRWAVPCCPASAGETEARHGKRSRNHSQGDLWRKGRVRGR